MLMNECNISFEWAEWFAYRNQPVLFWDDKAGADHWHMYCMGGEL